MYKITTDTGLEETIDFPRYISFNNDTNSWCIWDTQERQLQYAEAVMVKSGENKENFTDENGEEHSYSTPNLVNCDIDILEYRHEGFPLAHIEVI